MQCIFINLMRNIVHSVTVICIKPFHIACSDPPQADNPVSGILIRVLCTKCIVRSER